MFFCKPLYMVSILLGSCVFDPQGRVSAWASLWAVASLCAASWVGMQYRMTVARFHSYDFQLDIFSHTLPTVALFGKIVTCAIHLGVSIVRRRDFEKTFQALAAAKISFFHVADVCFGLGLGSVILILYLMRINKWPPYLDDIRQPHTVDSAGLVYFSIRCYYINSQFCCLVDNGREEIARLIKRLAEGDLFTESLHLKVTENLSKANKLYGMQTTVNCAQAFSYLLTHAYYLSTYDKFEFSLAEPEYKKALQFHAFLSLMMFYKLASSCESAAYEVDEFNCELLKTLLVNQDMRRNERLKLYAMVAPSIEFSACGFFNLGFASLLTSVITAVVTYVIVLVQFT